MRNTLGRKRLGAFMGAASTVALTLALAGAASANPHYDDGATSGGLHKVCTGISLAEQANEAPEFQADCNKEVPDTGQIEVVSASIELGDGLGRPRFNLEFDKGNNQEALCQDWEQQSRSDGVYLRAQCPAEDYDGSSVFAWTAWLKLNDGIEWNEISGELAWK